MKIINANASIITHVYSRLLNWGDSRTNSHPLYKNYTNIVARNTYIKPEIAECMYLETHECVAVLKTHWIRLIQRTWKNVMRKRADVIQKRTNPHALYNRQITGNWPSDCSNCPGLKGMLCARFEAHLRPPDTYHPNSHVLSNMQSFRLIVVL